MSDLNIEVVDISVENKGTYKKMSVTYKTTFMGKIRTDARAIMSFVTPPAVWETLAKSVKGDCYTIHREKDPKNEKFYNWVGIDRQDGAVAEESAVDKGPTEVSTNKASTFAQNDAARQRLIVRQSSLSNAIALVGPGRDKGEVMDLANEFCDWVFEEGGDLNNV